MTRFVIASDLALLLAQQRTRVPAHHQLLAPTLLRSEVLARLYGEVRRGALAQREAEQRLDHLRRLRIRLLGDRVLQRVAWQMAERLGWPDTYAAEYLALTQLQADAFVTLDPAWAEAARAVVPVLPPEALQG